MKMDRFMPTLLVTIFGSSTWLAVNAVWMELPLLVDVLPEKWNLPSYLALIVQLGDVIALFIGLCTKWALRNRRENDLSRERRIRVGFILGMLAMATLLMGVLATQWHVTAFLFGQNRSVAIFCVFLLLSIYCSGTNLLYLPHMISFDAYLVTPFFIGMGVSALVPSLFSLVQGVDEIKCVPKNGSNTSFDIHTIPPRFGVSVFMWLMAVWLVICVLAFVWLTYSYGVHQYTPGTSPSNSQTDINELENKCSSATNISNRKLVLLLILTGWVCVWMNSILPSIQIYATRPYGPQTYHLAITLGNVANPVACVLAMYVKVQRVSIIGGCTLASALLSLYIVILAAMSPHPLLLHSGMGSALTITANVLVMGVLAYLRATVAQIIRESASNTSTRLFWCGAATQFGSVLGALVVFPIVNVLQLFHMADQCVPAVF